MVGSDPVFYPEVVSGVDAERQRAQRARAALGETLAALSERTTARTVARRGAVTVRETMPGSLPMALAAGVLAGSVAAVVAGRVVTRGWHRAVAGTVTAGLVAMVLARARTRGEVAGRSLSPDRPVPREPAEPAEPGPEMPASPSGGDVVDVLRAQHRRIEALFAAVESADPERRTEAFSALVEFLHKHEHAEQSVVHRRLRGQDEDAARTVDGRLHEEEEAARSLGELIQLGVDDSRFAGELRALRDSVLAHATHEETMEFPEIRRRFDEDVRRSMANQVLAAQTRGW